MKPSPPDSWENLFAPAAPGPAATVNLRVVRRMGRPFLLLPENHRCAAAALALYPAQTPKARAAKGILTFALRSGLSPRLEKTPVTLSCDAPFVRFLCETAGTGELPPFAILPGNPHTDGRRYVILLFDTDGAPTAVVKAGISSAARRLIAHETNFLAAVPSTTRGVPRLRAKFLSPNLDAFALDFVPGNSPNLNNPAPLAELLASWIAVGQSVALNELPAWHRLVQTFTDTPLPPVLKSLTTTRVHPALTHGDCAPWNIKAAHGLWTMLDWERGELSGVPLWDCLHFVIQSAVLVRHETTPPLLKRLEDLFASPWFQDYAARAGVTGNERALALVYLNYCLRVIRPSEGRDSLLALESAATQRWFSQLR